MNNKQHPLCDKDINTHLKKMGLSEAFNLVTLDKIDSTNRYLKDYPSSKTVSICLAEHQSNGRGRLGRIWHSPYAQNIYLSCRWPFGAEINKLQGLSLLVSLAIYDCLYAQGIQQNLRIKWPNDVMWQEQKLAGTLIELVKTQTLQTDVIIGIGLNVNSDTLIDTMPDKPWCSMYSITGQTFDRNLIAAQLIKNLNDKIADFKQFGFKQFVAQWSAIDYLAGRSICVKTAKGIIEGVARGIDDTGKLKLQDKTGTIVLLDVGEPSIQTICN